MKKILFLLVICLFVRPAWSQYLADSKKVAVGKTKFVVQTQSATLDEQTTGEAIDSENEIDQTEAEEIPPTSITPEQKAEINIQSSRQTRSTIRVQTPRERRSFLDALQMLDKKAERQKAMAEGKTEKEIEKAADSVKTPKVDPLNDRDLEEYLFKKIDVNERMKKVDEE